MKENIHYIYDRDTDRWSKTSGTVVGEDFENVLKNFEEVLNIVVDVFQYELEFFDLKSPLNTLNINTSDIISNYINSVYRFVDFSNKELKQIREALIEEYDK